MLNRPLTPAVRAAVIAVLAILATLVLYWMTPYYSTQLLWELRKSLFWLVPLILVVAIAGALYLSGREITAVVVVVAGLVAVFTYGVAYHGYQQDKVYAESVQTTNDLLPDLGKRTPYSVAQAQSRTTLSNLPGADLQLDTTRFNPGGDDFTTLAKGRSLLGNYAAVAEQHFPLAGRSVGSQCTFTSEAQRALGGWFNHNLGRAINDARRGVNWSDSDAYGICDHGVAKVVVPLKRQQGWIAVTEVPAGIAIYDGTTGEVTITDDASKIPGTVYPLSLAQKQRESTDAIGTWWQWIRNQIGWKPAEGEVNSSNASEFVLGSAGGGTVYVTPLSNQGNSTGIAAMSNIDAAHVRPGQLNPAVVHVLSTPWVSVDAIESRIKADYQDIPNWQTLKVQEIVPLTSNRWYATLGNDQNTLYHVEGTGDLSQISGQSDPSVATCLYKADTLVRCGTLAAVGANGVGTQYGAGNGGAQTTQAPDPSKALSGMTDTQLAQELRAIADELARRAAKSSPAPASPTAPPR